MSLYHNLGDAIDARGTSLDGTRLLDVSNEPSFWAFSWSLTDLENSYEGLSVLRFTTEYYWLAPLFGAAYVAFVFIGPRLMANRKALVLATPLLWWNLFLAVFSIIGTTRVVPFAVLLIYRHGWRTALCAPCLMTYGRGAVGLWTMLFIYSKFLELVDSVFLVLRKRKLNFLHWYHHLTVLLYTWDAFVTAQPPGLFYCAMNYFVHSIMYSYYFLAAAKRPPSWGIVVTILQILQMIAGVLITCICLYLAFKYDPVDEMPQIHLSDPVGLSGMCDLSKWNLVSAAGMYSTYFYLFLMFFLQRYLGSSPKKSLAKQE